MDIVEDESVLLLNNSLVDLIDARMDYIFDESKKSAYKTIYVIYDIDPNDLYQITSNSGFQLKTSSISQGIISYINKMYGFFPDIIQNKQMENSMDAVGNRTANNYLIALYL